MLADVLVESPSVIRVQKGYRGRLVLSLQEDIQQLSTAHNSRDICMTSPFGEIRQRKRPCANALGVIPLRVLP